MLKCLVAVQSPTSGGGVRGCDPLSTAVVESL